jgi:hypothetical protein
LATFQWPDQEKGGMFFGLWRVVKMRLKREGVRGDAKDTFLSHSWLGGRIGWIESPLEKEEMEESFEHIVMDGNRKFWLASAKVFKDNDKNANRAVSFKGSLHTKSS